MQLVGWRFDLFLESQFVELRSKLLVLHLFISNDLLEQGNIVSKPSNYLLLLILPTFGLLGDDRGWPPNTPNC